jgi:hypothetical protein
METETPRLVRLFSTPRSRRMPLGPRADSGESRRSSRKRLTSRRCHRPLRHLGYQEELWDLVLGFLRHPNLGRATSVHDAGRPRVAGTEDRPPSRSRVRPTARDSGRPRPMGTNQEVESLSNPPCSENSRAPRPHASREASAQAARAGFDWSSAKEVIKKSRRARRAETPWPSDLVGLAQRSETFPQ